MVGIYKITNLVNGKIYIGQSIDIQRRFWEHRCISHESNAHLKNALRKYGKENFKYEVLEECSEEQLDEKERYYISTLNPEYNVTNGGQDSLRRYPEEIRQKISAKSKEQWAKMSNEEKAERIKNNLTGPQKGHTVSEKTRAKLREINTGKTQSIETIEKRKETIRNKKQSGYVQTNAGHRKKIICLETGEIFESVKQASEKLNTPRANISRVLKGKQKTIKGYKFEYLEV